MAINHIQTLFLFVSINSWPSVFSRVFSKLGLAFTLYLPSVGVSRATVFYFKMTIPVLIALGWKYLLRSPYQWKKSFILQWNVTVARYFILWLLVGLCVVIPLWLTSTNTSTANIGGSIGFGIFCGVCLHIVWFIAMSVIRYNYRAAVDENAFFCQFKAQLETSLLFLIMITYLPVTEEICSMISYQLNTQGQRSGRVSVANLTFAFVFLVAYTAGIPVWLVLNMRKARSKYLGMGGNEATQGSVPTLVAEMNVLHQQEGLLTPASTVLKPTEPSGDFLFEGKEADDLVHVRKVTHKYRRLTTDVTRQQLIQQHLKQHTQREAILYTTAVEDYQNSSHSNPFTRICMVYDDDKYWWKTVQLAEKFMIVAVIAFAYPQGKQLGASLAVSTFMFILAAYTKPFKDEDEHVSKEDRLDFIARAITVATLLCGLLLYELGGNQAAVTTVDVILLVINSFYLLLTLYQLNVLESLRKLRALILAVPLLVQELLKKRAKGKIVAARELIEHVRSDNVWAVRTILARDTADINYQSDSELERGTTCFHVARSATVLRELLDRGADLRLVTATGWNALHFAYHGGYGPCIDLLIKYGCRTDVVNNDGQLPHQCLDLERVMIEIIRERRVADMKWMEKFEPVRTCAPETVMNWMRHASHSKAWEVLPSLIIVYNNESLDLSEFDLGAEGFLICSDTLFAKPFTKLDLVENNITNNGADDRSIRKLAKLIEGKAQTLLEIDIRGNFITYEMAALLTGPIKMCKNLVSVNGYAFKPTADLSDKPSSRHIFNCGFRLKSSATRSQTAREILSLEEWIAATSNTGGSISQQLMQELQDKRRLKDKLQSQLQFELYEENDGPLLPFETAFLCMKLPSMRFTHLRFDSMMIGDLGAIEVAELLKEFKGDWMHLACNNITEAGILAMVTALETYAPPIKEMILIQNRNIGIGGLSLITRMLARNLPPSLECIALGGTVSQEDELSPAVNDLFAECLLTNRTLTNLSNQLTENIYPQAIRGDHLARVFDRSCSTIPPEVLASLLGINTSVIQLGTRGLSQPSLCVFLTRITTSAGLGNKENIITLDMSSCVFDQVSLSLLCQTLQSMISLKHLILRNCIASSKESETQQRPGIDANLASMLAITIAHADTCPGLEHLCLTGNMLLSGLTVPMTSSDGKHVRQTTVDGIVAILNMVNEKRSVRRVWLDNVDISDNDNSDKESAAQSIQTCLQASRSNVRYYLGDATLAVGELEQEIFDDGVGVGDIIAVEDRNLTSEQENEFQYKGVLPSDIPEQFSATFRVTSLDRNADGSLRIAGIESGLGLGLGLGSSKPRTNSNVLFGGYAKGDILPPKRFQVKMKASEVPAEVQDTEEEKAEESIPEPSTTPTPTLTLTRCNNTCNNMASKIQMCVRCFTVAGNKCLRCEGHVFPNTGTQALCCQQCGVRGLANKCIKCSLPLAGGGGKPAQVCQSCDRTSSMGTMKICSVLT